MKPKAEAANKRGLKVHNCYLSELDRKYSIVSLIHVFSHIENIREFLVDVKGVLKTNGELFLETGKQQT